jgi:transposase
MARYKRIDMSPRFLPVDLSRQIVPGSFEFALSHLIERLSLSAFEARYRNDQVGAPAYPPAVLLKIVLLAYSRGIIHSRDIETACRENVVFMAISGDSHPHFTTIAHFVATPGKAIAEVFAQVLTICQQEGLIGAQMFAIDGVKLPSNASKAKSGTRADFMREAAKMRAQVSKIIERHRSRDQSDNTDDRFDQREARQIERLTRQAEQIERWLEHNPHDRPGAKNSVRQSNRSDNQSAKIATEKGVIRGGAGI